MATSNGWGFRRAKLPRSRVEIQIRSWPSDVTNFPVEGSKYRFSGLSLEGLDNELSVPLMFPILFLLMWLNSFPKKHTLSLNVRTLLL